MQRLWIRCFHVRARAICKCKACLRPFAKEEATALNAARELARSLRWQREALEGDVSNFPSRMRCLQEEREAAERKAQKEMAAPQDLSCHCFFIVVASNAPDCKLLCEEGSRDEHGWMQTEYQALKQVQRDGSQPHATAKSQNSKQHRDLSLDGCAGGCLS